jgi:hypothetical protein
MLKNPAKSELNTFKTQGTGDIVRVNQAVVAEPGQGARLEI